MIFIVPFCPMPSPFAARTSVEAVEEGMLLAPKFDVHGLIPVITTDAVTGEVLMHAYMNEAALLKTLETGEAHYYSRSRQQLWHKGATSGLVQTVQQFLIDDDQDCLWMKVPVAMSAIALASTARFPLARAIQQLVSPTPSLLQKPPKH